MAQQAKDITPSLTVLNTQTQVENQGYTYNQAGFTYNQAGWFYGGIYNSAHDIFPSLVLASLYAPTLTGAVDPYTNTTPPPPNNQKPVGPGFFLYVGQ